MNNRQGRLDWLRWMMGPGLLLLAAAIVAPRFLVRGGPHIRATESQISTVKTALDLYRADNGSYPTTARGLQALVALPTTEQRPRRWKKYLPDVVSVPKDPWGNDFVYQSPGPHGEDFTITSYGPDGQPGGEDDITTEAEEGTAHEGAR